MSHLPIQGLTFQEVAQIIEKLGEPKWRALQVYEWLFTKGALSFGEMTNLSKKLRDSFTSEFDLISPAVEKFESSDGTLKYRMTLKDGASIESVWIPEENRNTLCISSQVGCALRCAFCITGAMGFKRNLSAAEIVMQVQFVKAHEEKPVSNIVFMGMGEPLLNVAEVTKAISVLTDEQGLGFGRRKITVSTAGIVPSISSFVETTGVKLAISLTGATNESRNHWMPINKKYNLELLTKTLRSIRWPIGKRVTFEVVVMKGVNDAVDDAKALVKLLKGIPAKVNLIPYNENEVFPLIKRPSKTRVTEMQRTLIDAGIHATVRKNRGEDILAACGQLAGRTIKQVTS